MLNNKTAKQYVNYGILQKETTGTPLELLFPKILSEPDNKYRISSADKNAPEVLFVTSFPPRECGIATYSQDLIAALKNKFGTSFSISVCALESGNTTYDYPEEVKYKLDTTLPTDYQKLAADINKNECIQVVLIQHEFGFFQPQAESFRQLLYELNKPLIIVFHTVIPNPSESLKYEINSMVAAGGSLIVMTNNSAKVLMEDYEVPEENITVIPHGTHLVPHLSEKFLKQKYGLTGKKVLSTFGLLSSGKSIETTLHSLPAIIERNPEIVFLIIGKTHPMVVKSEGEIYREMLETTVTTLNLNNHVRFVNNYLALPELLEYLQLTDIYLFTSKDPNQAVSGTFSYAMSCGCPIISTPIPHAKEVLSNDTGIIIDFQNHEQLANGVLLLLNDEPLRKNISSNTLQKIVSTAWENSAVSHVRLIEEMSDNKIISKYSIPEINLDHLKKMTTNVGMIQFSKINQPDIESGYTLDDNARALIAMCMHYEHTKDNNDLVYIQTYLKFIRFCLQPSGNFLNYVDKNKKFTKQNSNNLEDANGRAIWALGYFISRKSIIPAKFISKAKTIIHKALPQIVNIHSTRAMAFAIKGLYYYQTETESAENIKIIETLATRLVEMYKHESSENWEWFESYLTYANSVLPEAMLYAWLLTGDAEYKKIAKESLGFLVSEIFNENGIEVISNKSWLKKGHEAGQYGEQPIDVAYTIMTLSKFYAIFNKEEYLNKLKIAFNWFLGKNRLHQIIYNPCTGGCYDGLEATHVNLNQGAESTVSYLMARMTIEKH